MHDIFSFLKIFLLERDSVILKWCTLRYKIPVDTKASDALTMEVSE